ncbi:MAG: FG-GAP-like repeat-containing protein [Verrucomicrobiota bacterium]
MTIGTTLRITALWTVIGLLSFCQTEASEWHEEKGFRWRDLRVPPEGRTGFTLLATEVTGIAFTNRLSTTTIARNRILENGSGVALGDVDGDGLCDLYFCGLENSNALFRNRGDWKFEDVTEMAGVACDGQFSTGALLADVDGDSDLDLIVNSIGNGTRLFLNQGSGKFTEMTNSGLARQFGATSMAMGDIDGDGDLELYVAHYRLNTFKDAPPGIQRPEIKKVEGQYVVTPPDRFAAVETKTSGVRLREVGEPDLLYVNKGQGRFGAISWTSGAFADEEGKPLVQPPRDWGLSVLFRDLNGDSFPDLYVCNDFFYSPDRIWLNENGRRFRALPRLALRHMSMSSMAVDVADIDRDGFDDIFVADMLSRDREARHRQRANIALMRDVPLPILDPEYRPEVIRNTLFWNRGDGTYAEISEMAGIAASDWTWSAVFMDVDLDGYEDLLITNGHEHDVLDADTLKETGRPGKTHEEHLADLQKFPRIDVPNLAFHNQGNRTFLDASEAWGFHLRGVSHGMALADLDQDGDLDVVINNMNSGAAIYRNDSPAARIAVRLKGSSPNTRGIGSRIKVAGGPVVQSQEMISGGRYLSCDDTLRVFAAGSATNDLTIEVRWRSGVRNVIQNAKPNRVYEIDETGTHVPADALKSDRPWFTDQSARLTHVHHENEFNDFERQPLLPHMQSRLGPSVCWFDFDGDGWDDLIIGAGRGGSLAACINDKKGGFKKLAQPPFDQPAIRDQAGIVAFAKTNGSSAILVASSNYEGRPENGSALRQIDLSTHQIEDLIADRDASIGPLALADFDADGDLDLFAGGNALPAQWPRSDVSRVYKFDGVRFQLDSKNTQALSGVGLVSGAVWSDLDADGFSDLILACAWGPVRLFRNHGGLLREATAESGLAEFTGWWNSVATGDFDGDGKLDIVAGNWGLNSPYRASSERPMHIFFGDFAGRGTMDIIEAESDATGRVSMPLRPLDVLGMILPEIQTRFPTHRAFSRATMPDLIGLLQKEPQELSANTLASMLFLNRDGKFQPVPLPFEAQCAPVFGLVVADFDGDGAEDIFLSQNLFGTHLELPRCDAGRGLCLRNRGSGAFDVISTGESGIRIDGEQRGSAASDFNQDGRVDIAVAQNAGATRLYENQQARPGLRVRLAGPPGNPSGVGAVLRLDFGDRLGSAREVQFGSGYWSQNSAVQVLATPRPPVRLHIKWPGGKMTSTPIPSSAREIALDPAGKLTPHRDH